MGMSNPHPQETSATVLELKNDAPNETRSRLERINVMLSPEVLGWLTAASAAIGISRSEFLRGLVGGFIDHSPRFSGCTSGVGVRRAVGRLFDAFAQAQQAKQSTFRPAANTAPAPRDHQANGSAGTPRTSRASAGANRVGASNGNGKTVVATTIPTTIVNDQDLETRFDRLSESHPIASWPQEIMEVKTKYLELVTGSPALADSIEKAHAAWRAYWEDHQDGYIPPLIKWLADGYYLKTPKANTPNDRGSRVEALKASLGYTSGISK
jgi:hypothetical protein